MRSKGGGEPASGNECPSVDLPGHTVGELTDSHSIPRTGGADLVLVTI